jgi:CPSF A subunit region
VLVFIIAVRGPYLIVGDLMKSISILRINVSDTDVSLEHIARDPDTNWMTALEAVNLDDRNEQECYLGADNFCNLFCVSRGHGAGTNDKYLTTVGRFHLGQMVNRFRRGNKPLSIQLDYFLIEF